jgi:hypothetical protein
MRNAMVPVNRLPVEILQRIPSSPPYVCGIVTISHVCRYWRAAFLSYPDLWTFLQCRSKRATRAFLQRSQSAPLYICIRPGYSTGAFGYTIAHTQRWASLDVMVPRKEIDPVLTALSGPGPAPKLYNLSVLPIRYDGNLVTSNGDILGGVTPSLQRLALSNLKFDIHQLTIPNLTHLSLTSTRTKFVTMTVLLNFLERSPLLEGFELNYPCPSGDIAHPDHVVSLKHLHRIILWHTSSKFLNHLVLPDGIECELNIFSTDSSATTGFLEEMIGEPLERLNPVFQAESLSIVPDHDHGSVRFLGPSGFVEIIPEFFTKGTPIARFITFPPSVLENIKNLFVGSRFGAIPGWKPTDVREHVKKMASLESLTIMRCNNASFMHALLPAKGKVPCPALENLTIYIGPTEESSIPAFRWMVEQRRLHGHKFEKMVLVLCGEHRIHPAIPDLEVKVDDRELLWDRKKKLWRYPDEGEAHWEDDRSPGIMPIDPRIPTVHPKV